MRSKNCVSFFFQEDTSGKFLILCYLICLSFDCKYHLHLLLFFADCCGFSCVHVRASSYTALFRVSLHAIGLRVSRFCSKDICTLQHGFLCFLLFLYLYFHSLACIITHLCFFIPSARSLRFGSRLWKVNIDQNLLKLFSITICFREPLLFITLFLKIMCFYLLSISIRTWN